MCSACGILSSTKPVVLSFLPFFTTFSHSARGRIFENKVGDTLLLLCSFSFFYLILYLIPEHYSHCGVCSIISDPCCCFFYLFFFHNCLGVFFLVLPFHLFSPFLSISGVLIFPPSFSYSLVSWNHLRKIGMVVRNSYAYTSFFTGSCFVFFSFWKWRGNKKLLGSLIW